MVFSGAGLPDPYSSLAVGPLGPAGGAAERAKLGRGARSKGANQYQLIAISIVYWQSVASVPALQANTISLRRAAGSYRDISGVLGTLIVTQVVLFTWLRGSVADPSLQF